MTGVLRGAECVAQLLSEWGVQTLFAYPGTSELALCEAVLRTDGIKIVNARGDGEAVLLAAGANLAGRDVAACLLHGARGATNALGPIANLRRNEVPLVVIVGLPSSASASYLPPHAEPDLMAGLGHFAKSTLQLPGGPECHDSAPELISTIRAARREALRRPCGPVLIGLPADAASQPWLSVADWPAPARQVALDDGSDRESRIAAAWLSTARRGLGLLDDYALRAEGATEALADFARAFALPLLQVRYDRGPMLFQTLSARANPYFVARYNPASAGHRAAIARADVLVTIEDRNMYPRVVGQVAGDRRVAVTSAPAKAAINGYLRPGDLVVAGDVVDSLRRIMRHADRPVADGSRAERLGWLEAVRELCATGPPPPPARRRLAAAISAHLGTQAAPVLVDDSQIFGGLLAESYDLMPEQLRVYGDHSGFVGAGLGVAVGAALANPSWNVVACVGDSALLNGFKALFSGVEQRAQVLCVVCNNGGSVSLRKQAVGDHGLRACLNDGALLRNISAISYQELCTGLRIPYWRVTWTTGEGQEPGRLADALAAASQADGPAIVEIGLSDSLEFWDGLWRLHGFDETAS